MKFNVETNLKFVVLFIQNNFTYDFAASELHVSHKTICDWASFCCEVLISLVLHHEEPIGGINTTVEIDKSKFWKIKYNVGRVVEGQWVFGGICHETRQFFLVPVEDRTSETLLKIIKEKIKPGTTIISDCWQAYDCLSKHGFQHLKVNHSINFLDPETGAHTNTIERKWRDTKNLVPKFGRRKPNSI